MLIRTRKNTRYVYVYWLFVFHLGPIHKPVSYLFSFRKHLRKLFCLISTVIDLGRSQGSRKTFRTTRLPDPTRILNIRRKSGGLARKKLVPPDISSQHYVCSSWNQSTNFRWNVFRRSFTELLQITKENRVIILIWPSYTTVALHSCGRRIFGPFQTFLQQFMNIRFNTYQGGKVSGVHLGTVIGEVWKQGVSV